MPEALSGIRVLDFSRMYAGPFCSMILRELGAEVIKVEFRESGDACRTIPPITEGGEGYIFTILNRGKKSITLELREPEGRQVALDLIAKAEQYVEKIPDEELKQEILSEIVKSEQAKGMKSLVFPIDADNRRTVLELPGKGEQEQNDDADDKKRNRSCYAICECSTPHRWKQ